MPADYWHRQTKDKPLFPDLLWSRPENKLHAGKLLVIGGNKFGFAAAAEAYGEADKAGAGTVRVLLPDSLQKTVGKVFAAGEYAPSTPSGSFAKNALSEFLASSSWADGVLLAGDIGRNSETAILLEAFATKYQGQLTITKDAADYFTAAPGRLLQRAGTTLVVSFAQLQKLAVESHFPHALTFDMDLVRLADRLHDFSRQYACNIIVKHLDRVLVAVQGAVSTTQTDDDQEAWRVKTAARASVWWLQNPTKTFEALSTAIIQVS